MLAYPFLLVLALTLSSIGSVSTIPNSGKGCPESGACHVDDINLMQRQISIDASPESQERQTVSTTDDPDNEGDEEPIITPRHVSSSSANETNNASSPYKAEDEGEERKHMVKSTSLAQDTAKGKRGCDGDFHCVGNFGYCLIRSLIPDDGCHDIFLQGPVVSLTKYFTDGKTAFKVEFCQVWKDKHWLHGGTYSHTQRRASQTQFESVDSPYQRCNAEDDEKMDIVFGLRCLEDSCRFKSLFCGKMFYDHLSVDRNACEWTSPATPKAACPDDSVVTELRTSGDNGEDVALLCCQLQVSQVSPPFPKHHAAQALMPPFFTKGKFGSCFKQVAFSGARCANFFQGYPMVGVICGGVGCEIKEQVFCQTWNHVGTEHLGLEAMVFYVTNFQVSNGEFSSTWSPINHCGATDHSRMKIAVGMECRASSKKCGEVSLYCGDFFDKNINTGKDCVKTEFSGSPGDPKADGSQAWCPDDYVVVDTSYKGSHAARVSLTCCPLQYTER